MSGHGEAVDFKAAIKSVVALLLVLGGFWFLENVMSMDIERNSLFGLGFLVLGGVAAGRLCTMVGLPSLTGYLAAGLFSGPSFLAIVNDEQVSQLRLVNGLALALIAMHAGCEFTNEMLKKNIKSLFHSSWANIVFIGVGVTVVFYFLRGQVEFLGDYSAFQVLVVGAVFAAIAVSKSPAAVVAILGETKIRNRLSEHALGIVVILDVFVLVLFSVVLTYARSSLSPGVNFSMDSLSYLMGEIIASIAAGTFFGLFIILYLWLIDKERLLFIVAISYGVTALCSYLHYDTLLVFVVAGYMVTNFSNQSEKMISSIESLSSVVMIVFFATAGASLHVKDLMGMWQLVFIVFFVRFLLTWVAEGTAHKLARSGPELQKYGFTPFVSQAGLSIGLAMIVYERLPEIGPQLATLAISVITLNEMFGPILFKWGLSQVEKMKAD